MLQASRRTGDRTHGVEPIYVQLERTGAFRNTPGKPEGVPIRTFAVGGREEGKAG